MIKAFVITATHEISRQVNVQLLQSQIPDLAIVEAVYPKYQKIPFLNRLISLSKQRTGTALNHGEIGVLLSNRKIWRKIVKMATNDSEAFLILESDSYINDLAFLNKYYNQLSGSYDLFFFGAWSGHVRLEKSSKHPFADGYWIGEAFIKTVYGAYGYSINKKGASYLLKQTGKISHPVDQFKIFIRNKALSIGSIKPAVISHHDNESTIGGVRLMHPVAQKVWYLLLDIKNTIICYFK